MLPLPLPDIRQTVIASKRQYVRARRLSLLWFPSYILIVVTVPLPDHRLEYVVPVLQAGTRETLFPPIELHPRPRAPLVRTTSQSDLLPNLYGIDGFAKNLNC